jgi:hypothetical protein
MTSGLLQMTDPDFRRTPTTFVFFDFRFLKSGIGVKTDGWKAEPFAGDSDGCSFDGFPDLSVKLLKLGISIGMSLTVAIRHFETTKTGISLNKQY